MSEQFNPYYTWLGIPPEEQPANHYRLLGLKPFESNRDVISNAADQRMAHLRTLQVGKHGSISQAVLNEVTAAAACLLAPEKKQAYDQQLRQKLEHTTAAKASPQTKRALPQATPLPVAAPLPVAPSAPALAAAPAAIQGATSPVSLPQLSPRLKAERSPPNQGVSLRTITLVSVIVVALLTSVVLVVATLPEVAQPVAQPAKQTPAASPPADNQQSSPVAPANVATTPSTPPSIAPPSIAPASIAPAPNTLAPQASTPAPAEIEPPATGAVVPPAVAPQQSLPADPPVVAPPVAVSPPPPAVSPTPAVSPAAPLPETAPAPSGTDTPSAAPPVAAAGETAKPANKIPSDEQLAPARKQLLEAFGAEAQKATTPELKRTLAQKLNDLAEESKDDPAARYVLLDAARKLFAGAGEVIAAAVAADKQAAGFEYEPAAAAELQQTTLNALADANLTLPAREELADRVAEALQAAMDNRRFAMADELSLLGLKVTRGLKEPERKRIATQQRTAVTRLKNDLARYEQAQATLAVDPADPAANLIAGKFACTLLHNWQQGLAHLATSSETSLAPVIEADRAAQNDKEAQTELRLAAADAWFDWSERAKLGDRDLLMLAKLRAHHWYTQAAPKLTGLSKIRADKRMAELLPESESNPARPTAIASTGPNPAALPGTTVKAPSAGSNDTRQPATKPAAAKPVYAPADNKKSNPKDEPPTPGLHGLVFVEGRRQTVLVNYNNAVSLNQKHFEALLQPLRTPEQRVAIVLEGYVVIPAAGDYVFQLSGGSATGGVHTMYVAGQRLVSVTDSDNETRRLSLDKGEYAIRWEITGGADLGGALLHIQLPQGALPETPRPSLITTAQQLSALRAVTKSEALLGPAPRGK